MADQQWQWLIDQLQEPLRRLLLDDVRRYIQNPIDGIVNGLRDLRDRLFDALRQLPNIAPPIAQAISSIIGAGAGAIVNIILASTGILTAPLWRFAGWLLDAARTAALPLIGPLLATVGTISAIPYALATPIVGALREWRQTLAAIPQIALGGLLPAIYDHRNAIARLAIETTGPLAAPLYHLITQGGLMTAAVQGLPSTFAGALLPLFAGDRAARSSEADRLWDRVTDLGDSLSAAIGLKAVGGVPGFLSGLLQSSTGWLQSGYNLVADLVLGQGQMTPEMAPAAGMRAFLAASALGATAHLISTAVELVHPLRMIGLHYLSGFVAEMGDFRGISNALMGTMMRVGVSRPIEHYISARTRPTIPTSGDLQAMRRKHNLTSAEFARWMAYWGYSDELIQRYEEYLPADPRLLEIVRMAETGIPYSDPPSDAIPLLERMGIRAGGNPNWWLEMKFALAGYNWIDIPKLVSIVNLRITDTERSRLVSTASDNFRSGYMGEAEYRTQLADTGMLPAQIEWKVRAERLATLNQEIDQLVVMYTDQYIKDVITRPELEIALVNVGVTSRRAAILANRAAIRKMPKPARDEAAKIEASIRESQRAWSLLYKEQFRADLITADQYRRNLVAIGIRDDVATATAELEVTRKLATTAKVVIRAESTAATRRTAAYTRLYRDQYRAGQITDDQYRQSLVAVGVDAAEANAIVAQERLRRDEQRAAIAAARESAEYTRTLAAYERLFMEMFRAGELDYERAVAELVSVGVSEERARLLVMAEAQKQEAIAKAQTVRDEATAARAAQRAAAALAKARYTAGLTDEDGYHDELLAAGLDPELAAATVELAAVRRYDQFARAEIKAEEKEALAVQREQQRLYIRRYRRGEIDAEALLDNLVSIGIPDLLATATVALEVEGRQADAEKIIDQLIIPALKRPWTLFVSDVLASYKAGEISIDEYVGELIGSGLAADVAALIAEFA